MGSFDARYATLAWRLEQKREPDFRNLLDVLERKVPRRPTLFEFFLHDELYAALSGAPVPTDAIGRCRSMMRAFHAAGYDYVTLHASDFSFPSLQHMEAGKKTVSQNHDGLVTDRASFDRYPWPDPAKGDFSRLDVLAPELPKGMKFIVYGPGGVLENVIQIVGYEDLCFLMEDDMPLVEDLFEAVGARLVAYYRQVAHHGAIGALISNDDWGHATQTMLSADRMRELVVPWHREIARVIHEAGKPAILHSCGQLREVMDDIIDDIGYQGKHSYEDKILPVEQAYEQYHDRVAILGGIDLDYVCRETPEAVWTRAKELLERTATRGGYALGSGNSIPYYVPMENYLAMIAARDTLEG